MSRLAFSGEARFPDFDEAYEIYLKRSKAKDRCMDKRTYKRVIKAYCREMAESLIRNGIVDLPDRTGAIAAAVIRRRPQYRGKVFIGYGKMDWEKGHYDGSLKAFGLVYLPVRGKDNNLRCYGFVANRSLFKRMKGVYESDGRPWTPIEFNDEMI